MQKIDKSTMASYIDHTILKATATREQVVQLCREAKENKFASVCVNPCHVKLVAVELKGSGVKTCTVIGFPLGANTTAVKAFEAAKAVEEGAEEVDMVINVGALKDGDAAYVENDIRSVVDASKGALVKVIIETCYLTDEEKELACKLAKKAGADFVKTSTGFGTGGATTGDVTLMRKTVGQDTGVKASGGVRNLKDAMDMVEAGANRIGTSAGLTIIKEMEQK
ncbi:MAG: deoxyribose-phosphate aldolase [Clostridia bacterium]|nr:deoxyribose-phosphate aldolase [Clostridia bacterium]